MRIFLFKLFIFLLPILLLLGTVERRLAALPNGYKAKRAYMERGLGDVRVIVAGSSHAFCGVQPRLLGVPAYSIAYLGQDLYYDSRILLKYLPRAGNLKLVVVTVSYFSFEYRLEDSPEGWRTAFYKKFWDIPRASGRTRLADFSNIDMYGVQQGQKTLRGTETIPAGPVDEAGGFDEFHPSYPYAVTDAGELIKAHNSNMHPEHIAENVRDLEELLDALRARGVRAVIVTTPTYRSYFDAMNRDAYRRMQDEVEAVRRKYGLEYFDYQNDSRFAVEDFVDSNHLSTRGGEKFTRILRDEVLKNYPLE
jgi:hypothetical protein